ncbi:MAG: nucleotide exchange factor GrpE [Verrucomicrobiota bacterium]
MIAITFLTMSIKGILSVTAAGLVLVVGGIWLIRRKISRRIAQGDETAVPTPTVGRSSIWNSKLPENQNAEPAGELPITPSEKIAPPAVRLAAVTERITDSDLREFMEDITTRVQEEGPDFGEATSLGFIEELVDRMDDLRALLKKHQGQTTKDVELFRHTLTEVLSDCGVELIHSDEWDPSVQRAIAKEPTPDIHAPTILRFGTTGIRRDAQLVRKQEVVLAVPQ